MKSHSQSTDAFGQELWDYYQGKEVIEIVERDDGQITVDVGGLNYYFSDYNDWSPVEKRKFSIILRHSPV